MTFASQRCLNHPGREAVARCPECARFFCRECVVEHEDRILCASCLARLAAPPLESARSWRLASARPIAGGALGMLAAWLVFYLIGRALLQVPDDFHASTLWEMDWLHSNTVRTPVSEVCNLAPSRSK